MARGINVKNRVIEHITKTIQALWIGRVGNNAVRLDKAVNIRRTRVSAGKKNKLLKFRYYKFDGSKNSSCHTTWHKVN
jgi:hypothetical protein